METEMSQGHKEEAEKKKKKMKLLCLHGFRTSGSFLQKQISKWDASFLSNFEMVFPDGIFAAGGKSDIEGIFPPPYFEWFQYNPDFTEYKNLEECITYLCDYITSNGPFDGLLGFSQGATLSALLAGYQAQGKVLSDHPPFKLLVSVSGSKFRDPNICEIAYKEPIRVSSVHFIGAKDWLRVPSEELATAFDSPLIIRHPQGHTVPRLDEAAAKELRNWAMSLIQSNAQENGQANISGTDSMETESKQETDGTKINTAEVRSTVTRSESSKAASAMKDEAEEKKEDDNGSSMEAKPGNGGESRV